MRRLAQFLFPVLMIAVLAVAPAGCKRKKRQTKTEPTATQSAGGLATMVHAADPATASQLARGFHGVESNSWRWTAGAFAVTLRPPAGAAQKGAILQLKFVLPDVILAKVKDTTLTAAVNGQKLPPEHYTKPGDYTFSRDVPASMLQGEMVTVDFMLDKFLPASPEDLRDLGLIVTMVGFEAKP
jgi:hypothetical protein